MYKIFALKDTVSGTFSAPVISVSQGVIVRDLTDQQNQIPYFKDKALYLLGEFSADTGVITPQAPEFLLNCVDLILVVVEG